MAEAVMKRHPRLAVWGQRVSEFILPLACAVVAVDQALERAWNAAFCWSVGVLVLLTYEWRLRQAWTWGWNRGRQDTLERLAGLVGLESPEAPGRLREAYIADPPTWRQVQDQLVQVDHRATLRASLDELERLWAGEASQR